MKDLRRSASFLLVGLGLLGCDRCAYIKVQEATVNCGEDLRCFISRTRTCSPAVALRRERSTVTRYDVVGPVGSRCHLRRTQLVPDPRPDGGIAENECARSLDSDCVPDPGKQNPYLMQCLYTNSQAAEVMERIEQGRSTPEDLEPCYPGDGSCPKLPKFYPGCLPDECLLGRWPFVCEDVRGQHIQRCLGTRLTYAKPGCYARCIDGKEVADCRKFGVLIREWSPPQP
jgi:hypothetical protein